MPENVPSPLILNVALEMTVIGGNWQICLMSQKIFTRPACVCVRVCVCVFRFLRMSEAGLFGKWRSMYWPAPSNCSTGLIFTDVGSQALALADLVSAFLLLGLGGLLAAAALLAELACRAALAGRLH